MFPEKPAKIPEKEYEAFSLALHEADRSTDHPIRGHIELTFRCNLNCLHCYTSCFNKKESVRKELPFVTICSILDQLHEEGCLWLTFTGGEPLMRSDFSDIYRYAQRKGFLITIFTNGTLLNSKVVDMLSEKPPFSIEITVNSIVKQNYEKIADTPDTFELLLQGIDLLQNRNLPLKIKTQATLLNNHEIEGIKEFAETLGVQHSWDNSIHPRLNGDCTPYKYRLPASTKNSVVLHGSCAPLMEPQKSTHVVTCANGLNSFFIDPFGNCVFCNLIREPKVTLKGKSFKEIYHSLYPYVRNMEYKESSKCQPCTFKQECGRCPGISLLEKGNLEAPLPYYCNQYY